MKYVKLIAKPNTWFKEGTEVFDYDDFAFEGRRISFDTFENLWKPSGLILVRGIRICEFDEMGSKPGEERIDGESCSLDEFNIEIIEE